MIVTESNFSDVYEALAHSSKISLDTETTGLYPYKGDRVFSIIICDGERKFYFNFNKKPDHLGDTLPSSYILEPEIMKPIFELLPQYTRVYIHNAKFDMHQVAETFGEYVVELLLKSAIFCTEAMARLVQNDLLRYSLDFLCKKWGLGEKDKTVDKYISKHKLYTQVDIGKKDPETLKHYDLVPFEIMYEYGLKDADLGYKLGEYVDHWLAVYNEEQLEQGFIGNEELVNNEMELTKVLFKMEREGVLIDHDYCNEAFNFYLEKVEEAKELFKDLTGLEFSDTRKVLAPAFEKLGLEYPLTDKGNPSFTDKVLSGINNPIANIIKTYRAAYKNAFTYYKNFTHLSDKNKRLHCNFKQGGTATGRMSCREPNLQNVPKRKDTGRYKARRAFIPDPDYFFLAIDYDQMEYRLFMDYAEEMDLIQKVLGGLCVHTATAEMVDIERDPAKMVNFSLLYGSGDRGLASNLDVPLAEAKDIKSKYFRNLQEVQKTTRLIKGTALRRGYVFNLMGRRCYIPKKLVYKAPNYLIQGGCGDIVKKAMLGCDKALEGHKSKMLLQIHDELLFKIHVSEAFLVDKLVDIMASSYDYKHLPLTAGAEYSFKSWSDKEVFNYEDFKALS